MSHDVELEEVNRRNYENSLFSGQAWLATSVVLLASAACLEPSVIAVWEGFRRHSDDRSQPLPDTYSLGPYFMLVSFAVENLLKCKLVRSNPGLRDEFRRNGRLPKILQGHKLIMLAQRAGFNFMEEEEDLLRRLSRHATWAGRYPVPMSYKEIDPTESFLSGQKMVVNWFGGADIDRLKSLVQRLRVFADA